MIDYSVWNGKSRLGLLVGIDEYPGDKLHSLKGCVNDIDSLEAVLVENFDFSIVCLRNAEASREAILKAMSTLLETTVADSQIVFGWSGHGSTLSLPNGGKFETLVPCDSSRNGSWQDNRDITDRELFGWVWQVSEKTRFLTLIIDACQSGSIVREYQARPRGAAGDVGDSTYIAKDKNTFTDTAAAGLRAQSCSGWLPISDRYTLLAACLSTERCRETEDSETGLARGLFSRELHRALTRVKKETTWRRFFDEVADAVTRENAKQHPQLEGNLDLVIFGQNTFKPKPFLPVLAQRDGRFFLDGGAVQGVQLGSRWSIEEEDNLQPGDARLGLVSIDRVGPTKSEGIVLGDFPLAKGGGLRAFEISRPVDSRFRVLLDPGAASDREVVALLEASPYLDLRAGTEGATGDLVLYRISPEDAGTAADPLPRIPKSKEHDNWVFVDPKTEAQVAPLYSAAVRKGRHREVLARTEALARHGFLKRLSHPGDHPPAHATLKVTAYKILEHTGGAPEIVQLGEDAVLQAGDRIAFKLVHQHPVPLQVNLWGLGLTGSIEMLFPVRGRFEPFPAGQELEIGFRDADALEMGLPEKYPIAGDQTEAVVEDHLLFLLTEVSTRGLDLMAQEALRSRRRIRGVTPCDLAYRMASGRTVRDGRAADELANQESWGLLHWKIRLRI